MTTTEILATFRAMHLDPQVSDMGISGWSCEIWINGKLKATHGGTEADAVERAWEWLERNPIEPDDWGPS